jgi:predicted Zn-dependent protease
VSAPIVTRRLSGPQRQRAPRGAFFISHRNRHRACLLYGLLAVGATAALAATPAPAQIRLPDFGDSSETAFSAAAEEAVGREFMARLRATTTIIEDPEVVEYVESLGYRLSAAGERHGIGFHFFVVQDEAINAFAAPGGWVGINSGLVIATDSESELASVMAHEIAHVTQRHIARSVELSERNSIAALAGLLAAIAIGTQNSEAGRAAAAAVMGSQAQSAIDFTRRNEKEADRVGMQLLDAGGFDPSAMATFFEKLQSASRYYRRPPEFLSTHPVTTSRIAESRDRAAQLGYRQITDSRRYRMVRAKLRVMETRDPATLETTLRSEIGRNAPAPSPGLRYGLALLHARTGKLDHARRGLEALLAEEPDEVPVHMALAEVIIASGNEREALAILDDAWRLRPDNRLVARTYVGALLKVGRHDRALSVLAEYRRLGAPDAEMLRQEAMALEATGRTAESQATLAEHFYRRGQLDLAIHQLTLASRHPENDFYRASRIEARLEEMLREQAERARR